MGCGSSECWYSLEVEGEKPVINNIDINDKIENVGDLCFAIQRQLASSTLSHLTSEQLTVFVMDNYGAKGMMERRLLKSESAKVLKNKSSQKQSGIIVRAPSKGIAYCIFSLCSFQCVTSFYKFILNIVSS